LSRKRQRSKSQRIAKPRGVIDTSVLVAGIAGMKHTIYASNAASAHLLQRWVDTKPFVWLITEDVVDEYKSVLALCGVRPHVIGRVVNLLRKRAEMVRPGPSLNISPDPDDNHICDCAEYGEADFIVTLNAKDFPQDRLHAKVITPDQRIPGLPSV